jgi:hypothetical protein
VTDVVAFSDALRAGEGSVPEVATLVAYAGTAEQLDLRIARRREIFEKPTA